MSIRDVILEQRQNASQFEQSHKIIKARTVGVDSASSPEVAGRPGYIWVAEYGLAGGYSQVYNAGVPNQVNVPVLVYDSYPKKPHIRQARDIDWDSIKELSWSSTTVISGAGPHHAQHEWPDWSPGSDVMHVFPRAIVPLRAYPVAGLNVYVDRYRYWYNGNFVEFAGETFDWTALANSGIMNTTFILIYLDLDTNAIAGVANTVVTSSITGSVVSYWPSVPDNSVPSAIIMHNQQPSLTELMLTDVRDMYTAADWVARAAIAILQDPARWSFTYDSRDLPDSIPLVDSTWVQLGWYESEITNVTDTDGGIMSAHGAYGPQRTADFLSHVSVEFEFIDIGLTTEQVKLSLALYVDDVITDQIAWKKFDIVDGVQLHLDTFVPNVGSGTKFKLFAYIETTQTPAEIDYILRWFGHSIG